MPLAADASNHSLFRSSRMRQFLLAFAFLVLACTATNQAMALPSFARQTGQQCAACHNGFPELTPYGRLFKLNGYVFGGGTSNLPPLAVMEETSFTHTQEPQYGGAATHYKANDNFTWDGASIFYGGAIVSDLGIGAFAQATYNHIGYAMTWDNTDIRWAQATTLSDKEIVYGVSLNNNPTLSDPWNSTPAWGYPYLASGLAPTPGASALIEGALAQQVIGTTAYAFWNRLVYVEAGGYSTFSARGEQALGESPTGDATSGLAPYWRVAVEPHWGRNSWEVGTFGMAASMVPGRAPGIGTNDYRDIGFDTQYQFLADVHSFSVQARYIDEAQTRNSDFSQGVSSNVKDNLHSFHVKTSYYYDQTYGGTLGYSRVTGSQDALLYGNPNGSPNSTWWTAEIDYMPFSHGGPDFWPWLNLKVGLQYNYYTQFDGGTTNYDGNGHNAGDNNSLYAFVWLAF
jgi:hypothetical protein